MTDDAIVSDEELERRRQEREERASEIAKGNPPRTMPHGAGSRTPLPDASE
jgi:hypothetical protein